MTKDQNIRQTLLFEWKDGILKTLIIIIISRLIYKADEGITESSTIFTLEKKTIEFRYVLQSTDQNLPLDESGNTGKQEYIYH